VHLLDASQQGLSPDYTIADAAKGLRAGQAAWPKTPVMEITSSIKAKWLASSPDERLQLILEGKSSSRRCTKLSYKAEVTPLNPNGPGSSSGTQAVQLATDVKSLIQWLNHDILALAGPPWAERQNSLISSSKS